MEREIKEGRESPVPVSRPQRRVAICLSSFSPQLLQLSLTQTETWPFRRGTCLLEGGSMLFFSKLWALDHRFKPQLPLLSSTEILIHPSQGYKRERLRLSSRQEAPSPLEPAFLLLVFWAPPKLFPKGKIS